jgi:uncharacterized protein YbaP (TraB family)
MSVHNYWRRLGIVFIFLLITFYVPAQKMEDKKYPTLLWEITGNGLKKPSYLFGTMHVSSKMVFHLSDSFYFGIRSADVVALELDPQLWQDQLYRYQNMQTNLRFYTQGSPNNYLNEKSFQLERYEDRLRMALSEEPTIINGLLYRTFQPRADFEEDTYLDLYIYQTGKKLGKEATGVENYFETERLILEATQDMMKDKKKKSNDADGDSFYEIEKKTQDAYRKGDLDMLDSLERILQPSSAYLEKFLYRRNEIQVHSIDSILRRHSLFVGVGAAHLPGKRGVIELLRRKGYTLRPISMRDQDAIQRDNIDKVKVPVAFSSFTSEDQRFTVQLPGKLYKRADSRSGDSWQYADMSNGTYYMITRVKTHSNMFGQGEETVLKKIDSLLYENVPGKILKKEAITRNGYRGFDITNKTRRGDIQRYNILETPYEILVFKMSGIGNYVEGKEADQFFSSIQLMKSESKAWTDFQPARGGFSIRLPQAPFMTLDRSGFDGVPRWEYECSDLSTGDAYLVWKKSIQNYRFLDEDTFDLGLMEESFRLSDWVDKELTRRFGTSDKHPCLDALYALKDGSFVKTRFVLNGPHYYLLAVRSRNKNKSFEEFFDSFHFTPYSYSGYRNYTDTFVNIAVTTPVVPDIDIGVRNILERGGGDEFSTGQTEFNNYWPRNKTALFEDDSTGEAVYVSVQAYPKYYYPKDSESFWQDETNENKIGEDLIIRSKEPFRFNDSVTGVKYIFADTNSSRLIQNWLFLKDNRLYRVINLCDSLEAPGDFIKRFFASIRPLDKKTGESVFTNKLNLFFGDFYSPDSLTKRKAREAVPNIYFGSSGVSRLLSAIKSLPYNDKDYFVTKTHLINELGFITDSVSIKQVVAGLRNIYEQAGDTTTIQNAVLKALARNKTRESYSLLKSLLVQDPPVFNSASEYNYLFQDIGDSLALASLLFPDLLQLSSVDDYKGNVHSLLTTLVDSSYLNPQDYESYFSKLFFEAKIQLKKQQGKDENRLQQKNEDEENNDGEDNAVKPEEGEEYNELEDYAVLLLPFKTKNPNVSVFFDKMLKSQDASLRLSTAVILLRNDQKVADSIIQSLASKDLYRYILLKKLEEAGKEESFPGKYRNQLDIARSALQYNHPGAVLAAIRFVDKKFVQYKQSRGYVYFFNYKVHADDDWQMGISGLQPENLKEVSSNSELIKLTNKKIRSDEPILDQYNDQLKRLLFSKHKSAASFYLDNDYYIGRSDEED